MKRDWPLPEKAARRIAAHANSASEQPILWLIGVDESMGVVGVEDNKFVDWWNQVKSCFEGAYPSVIDVLLSNDGRDFYALLFDTTRIPCVVKHGDRLEVPWREATAVRSAKREELLRLLLPQTRLPNFDILGVEIIVTDTTYNEKAAINIGIILRVYVVPKSLERIVVPFHKCHIELIFNHNLKFSLPVTFDLPMPTTVPQQFGNHSTTIQQSTTELVVNGPGTFLLKNNATVSPCLEQFGKLKVSAIFPIANSYTPIAKITELDKPVYQAAKQTIWRYENL